MKNKINLKKYLKLASIITIIFLGIFLIFNLFIYKEINENVNIKVSSILSTIEKKYPEVTEKEIIALLNSDKDLTYLNKYGIFAYNNIIKENNKYYYLFLVSNLLIFLLFFLSLLIVFKKYEQKKNKELQEITNYIKEINKKNYSLKLDSISEDELSILKNEIYKTTIYLKEVAELSKKQKQNLKNSLEDISHQLKTPLTSILIMLDNLINDEVDENIQKEFLHDIKREVLNVNFLVQNILKLAKFDASTITFTKQKINLANLISKVIKNVSILCEVKNIKVNTSGDDSFFLGDEAWENEALTNILKNAIEYSKNGSMIDIFYTENKVYTLVSITNYGKMIKKEDLPHIFERFYHSSNSSKESVGIGLALAKTIILKDNGEINCTSNKEKTTFTIKYYK